MSGGRLARQLLELLKEHVDVCDEWEEHYTVLAEGKLNKSSEKERNDWLRENCTRPFLKLLNDTPFLYVEIIDIIPPAFKTTEEERSDTLKSLEALVKDWV